MATEVIGRLRNTLIDGLWIRKAYLKDKLSSEQALGSILRSINSVVPDANDITVLTPAGCKQRMHDYVTLWKIMRF